MNFSTDWDGPGERDRDSTIIECAIPASATPKDFDPFPGSEKAIRLGCTCPHQPFVPGKIRFDADCPVHELVRSPT
jgi:hypothetical protein